MSRRIRKKRRAESQSTRAKESQPQPTLANSLQHDPPRRSNPGSRQRLPLPTPPPPSRLRTISSSIVRLIAFPMPSPLLQENLPTGVIKRCPRRPAARIAGIHAVRTQKIHANRDVGLPEALGGHKPGAQKCSPRSKAAIGRSSIRIFLDTRRLLPTIASLHGSS